MYTDIRQFLIHRSQRSGCSEVCRSRAGLPGAPGRRPLRPAGSASPPSQEGGLKQRSDSVGLIRNPPRRRGFFIFDSHAPRQGPSSVPSPILRCGGRQSRRKCLGARRLVRIRGRLALPRRKTISGCAPTRCFQPRRSASPVAGGTSGYSFSASRADPANGCSTCPARPSQKRSGIKPHCNTETNAENMSIKQRIK